MNWRALATASLAPAPPPAPGGGKKNPRARGAPAAPPSHYAYCVGQAKAINTAVPEVDVSVVETGATVDNLKRMQKGTIAYGLITNEQVYLAHRGEGGWKDGPFPDLRNLWYYTISAVYVVVREET